MNIIILTLAVWCLFDPTVARLRENSNVLVPNNDVNFQAKMKKLLNDDEVDREDFSDNEIESLSAVTNPKIEKLFGKKVENKVHDEQNKNNEENRVDVTVMSAVSLDPEVASYSTAFYETSLNSQGFSTMENSTALPSTPFPTNDWTNQNVSQTITQPMTSPKTNTTLWGTPPYENTTHTSGTGTTGNSTLRFSTTPVVNNSSTQPPSTTPIFSNSTEEHPITTFQPPSTISTTTQPIYDDLQTDECILGRAERTLLWVNKEGNLSMDFITANHGFVKTAERRFSNMSEYYSLVQWIQFQTELHDLKFLSVAYSHLNRLPTQLLEVSNVTLQYLSLAGNDFSALGDSLIGRDGFLNIPTIRELDLRDCKMKVVKENFIIDLVNLQYLYLSNNQINELYDHPFPSNLVHIDLSYNADANQLISDGLKIKPKAFFNLQGLETLDFSFTKIETRSIEVLKFLPSYLQGLSLCYTELPVIAEGFLNNSKFLKYLDLSGNNRLTYNSLTFSSFGSSLQVLFARNSNVRTLEWTANLKSLKFLDLYDNNIHTVRNDSFSHMTNLLKLNLEKNSIGNWYDKLFTQNQQLEILNLRENKLTWLTNDMKEDLSSVKLLAIGNNEFECTCLLQKFMHVLFEATRVANITALKNYEDDEIEDDDEFVEKVSVDTTRVALGVRNYLRPEYDVISRTYQKYYKMVENSIEALRIRSSTSKSLSSSRLLIMRSNTGRELSFDELQTVLFDYDEDNDDYQCINATAKAKEPMIDLDLCIDDRQDTAPPYSRDRRNVVISLYISIPLVIIISVLVIVVYWKWWYVRYFFVLCKNSAILTFMDDTDSGKDAIVSSQSDEPVETFLYDVFVSYSESNRDWVLDEFISNVEKRESINVCLHERDFQVGYGILENIVSCMDRSRCLLLLVSENFLLSQWCQFEMNLAQHRLLETRRDKLILVLLEDIPERKQPKTLKYLMRTKTYIKWPAGGSADEKQLFWKRLKKSIISSKWETENYGSIV